MNRGTSRVPLAEVVVGGAGSSNLGRATSIIRIILLYFRSESCRGNVVNSRSKGERNGETYIHLQRRQSSGDLESREVGSLREDAVLDEEGERRPFEDVQLSSVTMASVSVLEGIKTRLEARSHEELRRRIVSNGNRRDRRRGTHLS
jgi:hypothetical protein